MTRSPALRKWVNTVAAHMPHLSRSQMVVLALWSFGIVVTQSCALTTVAAFLAILLDQKEDTMRQRLREWYRDKEDKKGHHRQELDVTTCFAPLLRWVLSAWPADEKRLMLVLDATTLGQLFTVLAISVVYRGCAIPVAWVVLPAIQKEAWKPHWLALLDHLSAGIPADWTVVVLADRGLYADWLYKQICKLGWHPFLRINTGGKFRLHGSAVWLPLARLTAQPGVEWSGRVICFKTHSLDCTLLVRWSEGHADPWVVITDLAPEQADICWYSLRPWIECGFKDFKRGGWQWQHTRITDPNRAARLWLAMAVAMLWVVSVGGEADANLPASTLPELPSVPRPHQQTTPRARPRRLSCFRRGILVILAALIAQRPLPLGRFYPEPWPSSGFIADFSSLLSILIEVEVPESLKTYP